MSQRQRLAAPQVRRFEEQHRALMALCLALEELAADLESGDVPATTASMAERIEPLVEAGHVLEEESLYPSFEANAGSCFGSLMITQIKSEHRVDRRAARELALTLRALANRRCRLSLATVAHMTRGFQEHVRRHVTAEQMLLDTLLEDAVS